MHRRLILGAIAAGLTGAGTGWAMGPDGPGQRDRETGEDDDDKSQYRGVHVHLVVNGQSISPSKIIFATDRPVELDLSRRFSANTYIGVLQPTSVTGFANAMPVGRLLLDGQQLIAVPNGQISFNRLILVHGGRVFRLSGRLATHSGGLPAFGGLPQIGELYRSRSGTQSGNLMVYVGARATG